LARRLCFKVCTLHFTFLIKIRLPKCTKALCLIGMYSQNFRYSNEKSRYTNPIPYISSRYAFGFSMSSDQRKRPSCLQVVRLAVDKNFMFERLYSMRSLILSQERKLVIEKITLRSAPRIISRFYKFAKLFYVANNSVRNNGGLGGVRPLKSMRDPCKVVICRDHGWAP